MLLLLLAVAAALLAWWLLRASLPTLDGERAPALAGLEAPATIQRDALGAVTIDAASESDEISDVAGMSLAAATIRAGAHTAMRRDAIAARNSSSVFAMTGDGRTAASATAY